MLAAVKVGEGGFVSVMNCRTNCGLSLVCTMSFNQARLFLLLTLL